MSKPSLFRCAVLTIFCVLGFSVPSSAQDAFDDPGTRSATGAAGDLRPVSEAITGDVALGASSQIVVLLRNDDTKPVKAGTINLYPSSNISASIGENQCVAAPIQSGEICAISIQIKGLQQGNYRIEMLMRHDGRSKLLTSTISGAVVSSGDAAQDLVSDIETIPPEIDFGSLDESRSQVKSVILRNITSQPIKITDISIEAGMQSGFTVKENCDTLETGEACVASVNWSPEQKGPSSGIVVVQHSGPTGVATVELIGEYDPSDAEAAQIFPQAVPGKGLLVSSQEEIDFGGGVEQSSSITISLVNTGDVPLTLTGIRMSNTENGVKVENKGCQPGSVLAPIEACPLTLTWEPVREGNIVDDLQISHDGARGVLVLPLRGEATKAINKNSKAIVMGGPVEEEILRNVAPLSMDDILDKELGIDAQSLKDATPSEKEAMNPKTGDDTPPVQKQIDVRGALDGYAITSYSAKRAIISGPGGSRVVFNGEQTVIGGILWDISLRPSAVEFKNGKQKVLLLFDRSLSSVNQNGSQSGSNGTTGGSTSSSGTSGSNTNAQ